MDHRFDKIAKAMATGTTRRQALRWLSGIMGGMLVGSPLTASAWTKKELGEFCKDQCKLRVSDNDLKNCKEACTQCDGNFEQICGTRGNLVCCTGGKVCTGAGGICCDSGQTNCKGRCCSNTCC